MVTINTGTSFPCLDQKVKEKQKWDKWKNREEQNMREYGVDIEKEI